jgi:hypothetical protein
MKEIKFSDIKPIGNFDSILISFRDWVDKIVAKCDEDQAYRPSVATAIKTIVGEFGMIEVLEEGIKTGDCWDKEEAIICLLCVHLLIIDLNNVAQKYLNKITMDSNINQLREYIVNQPEIFGEYLIVE